MITRRNLTLGILASPILIAVARTVHAETQPPEELSTSKLIYLTPIKSDGEESKCKAEIWFAFHKGEIFVVTPKDAWRAEAVRKDLTDTRIWVGEFGNWRRSKEAFRDAPELMATGSIVEDKEIHSTVLKTMGEKYSDEWASWGPRFKSALEDGSRVMIKYKPK
jgi:hypothetical protein